ncbi:hypothetical protein [Luteimonas salinilitoris]|uniref:Uncharacterized protein n=1 Tax=Luteimonas salinilitoris TaxID=3237697 RepID=A0ABV4HP50_9GAMM
MIPMVLPTVFASHEAKVGIACMPQPAFIPCMKRRRRRPFVTPPPPAMARRVTRGGSIP